MSLVLNLYRLQQVDSHADQITARLKVIDDAIQHNAALTEARTNFEAAEAVFKSAERILRQTESDVQAQRIKIEQAEASLYGGNIKNPKELQDLQNDVASLKRHQATLEDKQLEAMIGLEDAQTQHKTKQDIFVTIQSRVLADNRTLIDEHEKLTNEIASLMVERKVILASVEEADLKLYEQLRQQRRGVAVTKLADGSCAACGGNLTPGLQQSAKSPTQITRCPNCSRILYNN